jgi:hypothetical protein
MSDSQRYRLWDTATGELIREFTRLADAFAFVLEDGEAAVAQMFLKQVGPGGRGDTIAEGPELWALAESQRDAPPRHRVMLISDPVRGRDAVSLAVDLLKRVFLQGRLHLISIEVLREIDDGNDDWENVFVGGHEDSGELWMRAVERARAEAAQYAAAAGLQPSWEELIRGLANDAYTAGPQVREAFQQLRARFTLEARVLVHGADPSTPPRPEHGSGAGELT